MAWCKANRVDCLFRLARNERLVAAIQAELDAAVRDSARTGEPALHGLRYATLDSWSRTRRVIGKAEVAKGETNPRFIVTSLK